MTTALGSDFKRHAMEFMGRQEVDGHDTFAVAVRFEHGDRATFYISAETFRLDKVVEVWSLANMDMEITRTYFGERWVKGLLVPERTEAVNVLGPRTFHYTEVVLKAPLDEDELAVPVP